MKWLLALALMAAPAAAKEGGGAADPMRDALLQAIESAKREVDRPAPAPVPCFAGDDGPRVAVDLGQIKGRVPASHDPRLTKGAPQFTFDFPDMAPRKPDMGNLSLRVDPHDGAVFWDTAQMRVLVPDLHPEAEWAPLSDGRVDIGAGMSLLRGPDGAVLASFTCLGGMCSQRWRAGDLDLRASYADTMLPEWPQIVAQSEAFLRCAFPGAFTVRGAPAQNR